MPPTPNRAADSAPVDDAADDDLKNAIVYEHVSTSGRRSLTPWYRKLDSVSRAKLDSAIKRVRRLGVRQAEAARLVTPVAASARGKTKAAEFAKLRELVVYGKVQLRPLCCKGPPDPERELTLLTEAEERNNKLVPAACVERATQRYKEVVNDPINRRTPFPEP